MSNSQKQFIGRYQLLAQLGEGGMATVFKAFDTRLEREVAVKVIRREAFSSEVVGMVLKRFEREAKALAKLSHPNIVNIFDYGEHNGSPYLVMQYVPGGTLRSKIGAPMPYAQAVDILLPIASALEYAHERDILHRDVKPANILLGQRGEPLLSDFGIAKLMESHEGGTLTGTSVGVGTPEYMAPEQGMGQAVDGRADIYALGIIFYELLTGHKPYVGDTPMAVILKHVIEPLPPAHLYAPGLPERVERVLATALEKKPDDRYASMTLFIHALEGLKRNPAPQKEEETTLASLAPQGSIQAKTELMERGTEITEAMRMREPAPTKAQPLERTQAREERTAGAKVQDAPTAAPFEQSLTQAVDGEREKSKIPAWVWIGGGGIALVLCGLSVWAGFRLINPGKTPVEPTNAPQALVNEPATETPAPTQAVSVQISSTPELSATQPALPTESPTPQPTHFAGEVRVSTVDGMEMVFVPQGDFEMGASADYLHANPAHRVYLDAYWIDRTEVTNAQYALCVEAGACMNAAPNMYSSGAENLPVVGVGWVNATAYCRWAGRRLPSEAEWEKAARGLDGRSYPWGEQTPTCDLANYGSCKNEPVPVGSYPGGASPYGALDMAGNVWEWVNDWYNSNYYTESPYENPTGPTTGNFHMVRGGSYLSSSTVINSANREGALRGSTENTTGFRCAMDVENP